MLISSMYALNADKNSYAILIPSIINHLSFDRIICY